MEDLIKLLIKKKWLHLKSSVGEVKLALWNHTGVSPTEENVWEAWEILSSM